MHVLYVQYPCIVDEFIYIYIINCVFKQEKAQESPSLSHDIIESERVIPQGQSKDDIMCECDINSPGGLGEGVPVGFGHVQSAVEPGRDGVRLDSPFLQG